MTSLPAKYSMTHPMRKLMMLCETFHGSRTVSGSPFSRHVTVYVNPTPETMLQILISQQDKISNFNDGASIRVVSAKNGNIGVADGHHSTHLDIGSILQDTFNHGLFSGDISEDNDYEHDWTISTKLRPKTPWYDLHGIKVRVTYWKDTDGYATGKATQLRPSQWPVGLRRAFGL